ncbi:DUF5996 family protein [Sphingomonas sp. BN140010]|uniref:DUF5996 family protein n=1 Tax=Sphingomonas arvum TaxID=2992113 RepID=A0ABT3JHN5_9SPHN|nr:DUF5996 family protein [Sphingomonas sp. BN140010]MCW3798594.1 DUF5996 family protein [Sphingomonas sp. BN140010]
MSEWPRLDGAIDRETLTVLHLASQMLGKVRIANAPWVNHGWHLALQPQAGGFATLPTTVADGRSFALSLDLCRHVVDLRVSDGSAEAISLEAGSVAAIHGALRDALRRHGLPAQFNDRPSELPDAPSFSEDKVERHYDREVATRFRDAIGRMLPVFNDHRASFAGKSSPVHFWWGAFDLAVSFFSGRRAPTHPGNVPGLPDRVAREAYSHEVSSAGFWAAGATAAEPFFYSYLYPEPAGYRQAAVRHGRFDTGFGEWILPHADVAASAEPERMLAEFFRSAYEVGADLAKWDRQSLDREIVAP